MLRASVQLSVKTKRSGRSPWKNWLSRWRASSRARSAARAILWPARPGLARSWRGKRSGGWWTASGLGKLGGALSGEILPGNPWGSQEQVANRNSGDLAAVEHERHGFGAGEILPLPVCRRPPALWFRVHLDLLLGQIENPVDRNTGPGVKPNLVGAVVEQ